MREHGAHQGGDEGHSHIHKEDHQPTYYEKRLTALTNLLYDKGIITIQEMQRAVKEIEATTPAIGARVVAKAWTDPRFKARLLKDGKAAMDEIGVATPRIKELKVVESTDSVHYLTVCTLCSCYPTALLGPSPDWYKDASYRSRAMVEPRAVLKELGVEVGKSVEIRVVDSTADLRFFVLPKRPRGTDGMGPEELAQLVTRDSMVGAGVLEAPSRR